MKKIYINIKNKFPIYDILLIFIMLLLVIHAALSVMFFPPSSSYANSIDVVLRGGLASIFGYFISSNFAKVTNPECNKKESDIFKGQIFIIGVICFVLFITLIFIRNFVIVTEYMVPTVSQFRDMFSACIGFLIGIKK